MQVIVTYGIRGIYTADLDEEESDPQDWAISYILTNAVFNSSDVQVEIRRTDNGERIA